MYKLYQALSNVCKCTFDAHSKEIYVYDNFDDINDLIKDYHINSEYLPIKAGKSYTYGIRLVITEYSELEKSLNSVDAVFVEPAKAVMLKAEEPKESVAAKVREVAAKLDPIVQGLFAELEPDLLEQDAMMGQVQRDFCDAAPEACRTAWV